MSAAMSVQATIFQMESFEVLENGNTYWLDEFDDGDPPRHVTLQNPAEGVTNPNGLAYLIADGGQIPGPETAEEKLVLDTSQGGFSDSTVIPGITVKRQRARVASPTDPTVEAALTIEDAIRVTGVFDLIEPEFGETFRVRLNDWNSVAQNEILEAGVFRRPTDGEVVAAFRRGTGSGGFTVLEAAQLSLLSLPIDLADYEPIALFLANDPQVGGATFGAGFELIDSDNAANNRLFNTLATSTLFNFRPWVRAELSLPNSCRCLPPLP